MLTQSDFTRDNLIKCGIVVVVTCAIWHPLADRVLIPLINLVSGIIPKLG